jgi:hypothetical protein
MVLLYEFIYHHIWFTHYQIRLSWKNVVCQPTNPPAFEIRNLRTISLVYTIPRILPVTLDAISNNINQSGHMVGKLYRRLVNVKPPSTSQLSPCGCSWYSGRPQSNDRPTKFTSLFVAALPDRCEAISGDETNPQSLKSLSSSPYPDLLAPLKTLSS